MEKKRTLVRERARSFFEDLDPSHDWLHVRRVEELADKIAEEENADTETVKIAVLLHDIGRKKEDEGEIEDHSSWGAEKARKIMEEIGYRDEIIDEVAHCIEAHRYSETPEPETLEAKVLSDADNLDALGATGVARTFAVAGERGDPLADPELPPEEDSTEEGETALNHFHKKILNLKERMYTQTGIRMAEERTEFTQNFVERLEEEIREGQ